MTRRIGKAIIVISLVLSWNPYLLLFVVPSFLIGVILLWRGQRNRKSNILWTILPVLLWYPLGLLFLGLTSKIGMANAQKFDFIIPNGFRGNIIIVTGVPCGQQKIMKDGREQLLIPANGILLYREKLKYGYVDHNYYFSSGNKELTPIPNRQNYMYFGSEKHPPPTNVVGAWLGGTGNKTIGKNVYYEFMTLTIGSKDSIGTYSDFQKERQFEALTDSLVTRCLH